jgi:hypothetical protein
MTNKDRAGGVDDERQQQEAKAGGEDQEPRPAAKTRNTV